MALSVSSLSATIQDDIRNMPANTWMAVPNTRLDQSPLAAPNYLSAQEFGKIRGNSGFTDIMEAWNSGVYDSLRNRLLIFGGGHNDYYGNEIYAFDFDTMAWERVSDPTLNWANAQDPNSDGTASSRHTYNGMAYISHKDQFFVMGGALNSTTGGCGSRITWVFDLVQRRWIDRSPSGVAPWTYCEESAVYDPESKKVWWAEQSYGGGTSGLYSYDVDANQWMRPDNFNEYYGYTMAMDSKEGLLFLVAGARQDVQSYDIRRGILTRRVWNTTGGSAFLSAGGVGFEYDPDEDRFVGWGGGSVYDLEFNVDTSTGAWTRHDAPNAPPLSPNGRGVYGRWRYVPSLKAFALANATNQNVYFYKFAVAVNPPPPARPRRLKIRP
jgi:hypothetical protein